MIALAAPATMQGRQRVGDVYEGEQEECIAETSAMIPIPMESPRKPKKKVLPASSPTKQSKQFLQPWKPENGAEQSPTNNHQQTNQTNKANEQTNFNSTLPVSHNSFRTSLLGGSLPARPDAKIFRSSFPVDSSTIMQVHTFSLLALHFFPIYFLFNFKFKQRFKKHKIACFLYFFFVTHE